MPFFILIVGAIFLVAAIRGNQDELLKLIRNDFSGQNNFIYWVMAIVFISLLGNIKAIKPVSDAFLFLVILVIIVASYKKGDLISSFINQVKNGTS